MKVTLHLLPGGILPRIVLVRSGGIVLHRRVENSDSPTCPQAYTIEYSFGGICGRSHSMTMFFICANMDMFWIMITVTAGVLIEICTCTYGIH